LPYCGMFVQLELQASSSKLLLVKPRATGSGSHQAATLPLIRITRKEKKDNCAYSLLSSLPTLLKNSLISLQDLDFWIGSVGYELCLPDVSPGFLGNLKSQRRNLR
jgi:hypothetical protein